MPVHRDGNFGWKADRNRSLSRMQYSIDLTVKAPGRGLGRDGQGLRWKNARLGGLAGATRLDAHKPWKNQDTC